LFYIRECIKEKNPMNAVNVEKPSLGNLSSLYIRDLFRRETLWVAVIVEKPLRSQFSVYIRGHRGERPVNTLNVGKSSVGSHSLCIRELMQMRNIWVSYM
jgi:hypothetical protein